MSLAALASEKCNWEADHPIGCVMVKKPSEFTGTNKTDRWNLVILSDDLNGLGGRVGFTFVVSRCYDHRDSPDIVPENSDIVERDVD